MSQIPSEGGFTRGRLLMPVLLVASAITSRCDIHSRTINRIIMLNMAQPLGQNAWNNAGRDFHSKPKLCDHVTSRVILRCGFSEERKHFETVSRWWKDCWRRHWTPPKGMVTKIEYYELFDSKGRAIKRLARKAHLYKRSFPSLIGGLLNFPSAPGKPHDPRSSERAVSVRRERWLTSASRFGVLSLVQWLVDVVKVPLSELDVRASLSSGCRSTIDFALSRDLIVGEGLISRAERHRGYLVDCCKDGIVAGVRILLNHKSSSIRALASVQWIHVIEPIRLAAARGNADIVILLLDSGLCTNQDRCETFYAACLHALQGVVEHMLRENPLPFLPLSPSVVEATLVLYVENQPLPSEAIFKTVLERCKVRRKARKGLKAVLISKGQPALAALFS